VDEGSDSDAAQPDSRFRSGRLSATSPAVREWIGAMAVVVGVAAVLAFLILLTEPTSVPRPAANSPTPSRSATPNPSATPDPGPPPAIVLVEGDLLVNPPADGRSIGHLSRSGGEIVAATGLGEREGHYATGLVGSENEVCIYLAQADDGTAGGSCASYAVFEQFGLRIDDGMWQVRWWADGRVEWTGN
jgi:hypothetical protein